jgi:hypothetical protein
MVGLNKKLPQFMLLASVSHCYPFTNVSNCYPCHLLNNARRVDPLST